MQDKDTVRGNDVHAVLDSGLPSGKMLVRITSPDGTSKEAMIDKDEFWTVAFSISEEKKQEMLIPTANRGVKVFVKQIKLKLHKNMRAGETVTATVKMTVPIETLVEASTVKNGILVPR